MGYFEESTMRIQRMRRELLDTQATVCTERAVLATRVYKAHEMDQTVLKRAYMLKEVLENMTIYIEPETLIVGNQACCNRAAPIFPEYAMDWVIRELDEFDKRPGDRFTITEENKQILRQIYPYWKGRTLQDKAYAVYPAQAKRVYDLGIIRNEGNITSGDAHLAVDYRTVLEKGLGYVAARTQEKLDSLNLADFESMKKSFFYRAILIVVDAVAAFAARFARLAEEEAAKAAPQRAAELREIVRICRKVPMAPAETFHEALQSVWFIHLILQIESNGHSLSFGRLDQFCYPYYQKSRAEGMTVQQAEELLENLWIKVLSLNKIRSWGHSRFAAGSPLYQNVTIGGMKPDGSDGVNELSFAILRSVAKTHLPQPNLTVRYFSGMSREFMEACIACIRVGFGMPAFNNDEIIVKSLTDRGVTLADARDYSAIGCVEVGVPGKWGYRCTGMSYLNFPKTLMTALNDGVDVNTGERICEGTGHFRDMESFDDVMRAWDVTARQLIRIGVTLDNCADMVVEQEVPDILCSALVDDCIQRGLHLKEGGAHYDIISQLQVGVANLGDSLAALKKLVYEEKKLTRQQLWQTLMDDFAGEEGKRIQRMLLEEAPKFGNDDDYVDSLILQAYDTYMDEIQNYRNTRFGRGPIGGTYFAGTSSVAANVPQGAGTCATPDGRNWGEPLAEGCSPAHGRDKNGPTAVFKSLSKLRTSDIFGGVLLNQKVVPQILEKEEDRQKLELLIRTFFDVLHGWHVQYNVVSRETLLDAQKHPEKYPDLIVRVAGYSAFFNVLSPQTQNDIIARTEQTV